VRIDVLGPIEVTDGDRAIALAGQRQRALLAALVLGHGKVVPVARLVDALWDARPPATARAKIHAHISALRQAIGYGPRDAEAPLLTRPPGYLLCSQDLELDLMEFGSLTAQAGQASGSGQQAAASGLLAAALALWRGSAFADVESPQIRAAGRMLEERRMLAIEAKAEADLALGRCEAVVTGLSAALTADPFRERMRALLMVARYRLGCRADALSLYREGHQVMVAELGLEPGPQLRNLQQRILADDPSLQPGTRQATPAPRSPQSGPA
jgi:DNA-binding SARP family transcriptional activator